MSRKSHAKKLIKEVETWSNRKLYTTYSQIERNHRMTKETLIDDIRYESGDVEDSRKLVAFLYTLMRDYVTPGIIADIIKNKMGDLEENDYQYANGWLAEFAKYIADKLTDTGGEPCGD